MPLPGPSGCLQLAPGVYRHHCSGLSSGTGCDVAWNTPDPGTSLSSGTPGKSFGSSCRSATVTYPVAFTNRSNSALVTGVRSIQNPSSETRCTGSASGMPQPSHPIQNVPPGIHTMFAGASALGDRQPAMEINKRTRDEKSLLLYKTMRAVPDILKF